MNEMNFDVVIEKNSTQKYVLLQQELVRSGKKRILVRGHSSCKFHADVFSLFESSILLAEREESKLTCLGGGRITFTPPDSYRVHGYSVGYGKADHSVTADLLKKAEPGSIVTFDDEGY